MSDKANREISANRNGPEGTTVTAKNATYHFSIPKPHSLTVAELSQILPPHFICRENEDHLVIILETESSVSDDVAHFEVRREFDRIFFLTGEDLHPSLLFKECDGLKEGTTYIRGEVILVKRIDPTIDCQEWRSNLVRQLRYWRLSVREEDVSAKVQLLFKVIEITFPDTKNEKQYPVYSDPSQPPAPGRESKLLRDFVSHEGKIFTKQLREYCKFLGRSDETKFFDPTDSKDWIIVNQRLHVVQELAREVIDSALTRRLSQ